MLPERDLPLRVYGARAFFDFLGPQDESWLKVLIDEAARFEGRRWRELVERLAEPLPCQAPHFKRRCATRVLARLWRRQQVAAAPPLELRAHLFETAARDEGPAIEIVAATAKAFGLQPEAVTEALFADLPTERRVRAPDPAPSWNDLMLRTNLAVAQAVLMRASRVDLRIRGAARPVVRLAKLHGLLCVVRHGESEAEPALEISGPFSLFRHTLLYGRALASLLPHLAWCARFDLRAEARLRGRVAEIQLESGAPLFVATAPPSFDSRLEERFARDFARAAPDWHLVREPEPVAAGRTLIFPDFSLQHRIHEHRRVLVELCGFWTPEYLANKLARLREASAQNLILCIDEDRACVASDLPPNWPVLRFRRRVDAAAVLALAERLTDGQGERVA